MDTALADLEPLLDDFFACVENSIGLGGVEFREHILFIELPV